MAVADTLKQLSHGTSNEMQMTSLNGKRKRQWSSAQQKQ
jgi:hypothetical protein